jgi:hypothetical protein
VEAPGRRALEALPVWAQEALLEARAAGQRQAEEPATQRAPGPAAQALQVRPAARAVPQVKLARAERDKRE